MRNLNRHWRLLVLVCGVAVAANAQSGKVMGQSFEMIQHGKMHDVVGHEQHQGRILLTELLKKPGLVGVAALEGLEGEGTIINEQIITTRVNENGELEAVDAEGMRAALVVGANVPSWAMHRVENFVPADEFDSRIEEIARVANIDTAKPFPFVIEGDLANVRAHVIHGACPIRARMREIELPASHQPFAIKLEKVSGTLVGVFAKNSVGDITHPDTSTHMHVVFVDPLTGKQVTGHVERVSLTPGTVVRVPK